MKYVTIKSMDKNWIDYIEEYEARHGRAPAYLTETMGCQMNERDSETIAGLLSEMGYQKAESRADADVIVVNTCSVRDNADKRFFGILGQLKKVKEKRRETVVAVCGCMMQQQHVVDQIKEKYGWVDIVFGTHNIHSLPTLLKNVAREKTKEVEIWDEGGDIVEHLPAKRAYSYKAYVNIMYGCNNFCTYCIVPYTRGRERSRAPEDIVSEVQTLANDGVLEITLLGQNVNSYRGESSDGAHMDFTDLLYRLNEIDGIERIRFMTSHPKDLSDRLIGAYKDCEKLCNVIHLPVQSGSSRILKLMNRHYTRADYLALVEKLKNVSPDIAITTDIITGFPGETEEDFNETMSLVEAVRFDSAFTFLYSIRKGTPAEKFSKQVPEDVKHARFNRLVDRLNEITAEKNNACLGKTMKVLVEGPSKTRENILSGRTESGKIVNFDGAELLEGSFANVKITGVKTFSLYGELTE